MGILITGILSAACVSQPTVKVPEMTTVKVAYLPLISNAPLFIAKDEGYFTQQGINVEFEKFQSGAATLPALVNGDIAVSGGALSPGLFNAIAKGRPYPHRCGQRKCSAGCLRRKCHCSPAGPC